MDVFTSFKKVVLFFPLLVLPHTSFAKVLDVDIFGLSVHLGASYAGAPRKLDGQGVYVFNPGIGLGLDSRESALTDGFSLIGKAGVLEDCNAVPLYYGVVGFRYAHLIAETFTVGLSASLGIMNGQDWVTKTRSYSIMPLPILEIGKKVFTDDLVRLGMVIAPGNNAMSATSGGTLLLFVLSYSHSL